MKEDQIRTKLIEAGVRHLKEVGYPQCDAENIFTDYIYGELFHRMLEGTIEEVPIEIVRSVCRELMGKIQRESPKDKSKSKGKKK